MKSKEEKLIKVWNEVKDKAVNNSVYVPIKNGKGFYFIYHTSINVLEVFHLQEAWLPDNAGALPFRCHNYVIICMEDYGNV